MIVIQLTGAPGSGRTDAINIIIESLEGQFEIVKVDREHSAVSVIRKSS